jgi:hypothetical protein
MGIILFIATRGESAWQATHKNHLCKRLPVRVLNGATDTFGN